VICLFNHLGLVHWEQIMKRNSKPMTKPETIDEYLATLSAGNRAALQKLRKAIRAAEPEAEECISYEMPAFRLDGKLLVSFAAWANHCAFYAGSAAIKTHKDALKAYETSKGTIRFRADEPLPASLVRKLVGTRIAQRRA
jgi:uncharacterized protein YdhG (YjbR/CyaY superfamily)